jgi:hypothetical protein
MNDGKQNDLNRSHFDFQSRMLDCCMMCEVQAFSEEEDTI